MKRQIDNQAERLINTQRRHDRLRRAIALLSAVVILLTMSSLKMSADTLERIPMCGIHEHVHTQACYSRNGTSPACGMEEHVHTDACYQQRPLSAPAATRMDGFIALSADVNLTSDISVIEEEVADVAAAEISQQGLVEEADEEPEVDDYAGFELGENGLETAPESEQQDIVEELPVESDADAYSRVYSMEGQASVQLSRVLYETGLELDIETVTGVTQVLEAEDAEPVVAVEPVEGDYIITPVASFDAVELAIFVGEDIHTVKLVNAVVDAGAEPEDEDKEEETAIEETAEKDNKGGTAIEETAEEGGEEGTAIEETAEEGGEEETAIEGTEDTETVEADVTAVVEDANVTIVAVGENSLPADSGIVYNENINREAAIDELNSLLGMSATSGRRMMKANRAMAAQVADAAPEVQSDYAVFDIAILADGGEYSETGEVEVTVRPDDVDMFANLPEGAQVVDIDYTLYHVHEGQVETLPVQVDAENGVIRSVSFNTASFSNFILKYDVKYTVDFEYTDPVTGETFTWSWPGEGSYSIASIMAELGVEGEIESVELTRSEDVGGAENVLYLEEKEDGWYLTSDAAFQDTFELKVVVDGVEYIVIVTDMQITADVLTHDGETYVITVTCDDDAGIPADASLQVEEILPGTEAYEGYLVNSAAGIGADPRDITFARFFNIEIVHNGEKIEPDVPVQVEIAYKEPMALNANSTLSVVHFADEGTEIISDVAVSADNTAVVYEQASFSVTGTIVSEPTEGKQYAVIVKKDGKYYSVFNDGTLVPVDSAYDPSNNTVQVYMDYPLVWTYTGRQASWGYYHTLSIPSTAIDFWPNHLPIGFYYRYINAKSETGMKEEDENSVDLKEDSAIWYYNNRLLGYVGSDRRYIGISEDGSKIIGNQPYGNSAEIYLAEVSVPPANGGTHDDHMVNHIDIAIAGNSTIKVPLAYGDYYAADGTTVLYTATPNDHILEVTPSISLSTKDMKNATIKATAIVDGQRVELDDVFYVTGYSQNDETSPDKLAQIRIEGSFKVSNIDPEPYADLKDDVCQRRKANPIDYTVSVVKTVTVKVTRNGQQLYTADRKPLEFEIPIAMSASFNYWQDNNECPPVIDNADWKNGKIIGEGETMSGMDFDLGTAAASDTPAIEIKKVIQKEDGSYLATDDTHDVDVNVYYKAKGEGEEDNLIDVGTGAAVDESALSALTRGYRQQHSKTISVGKDGVGAIYDFDVDNGLIYIQEDEDSVDKILTGTDGKLYQYVSTRMETEYVWRTTGDDTRVHNANGTKSVPEVLGPYAYRGNPNDNNNEPLNNTFLEFYIYNVYREIETVDVPVDKSWPELDNTYTWSATFELEELEVLEDGPANANANTTVWRKVEGVEPITITNESEDAARTFTKLPKYRYYANADGSFSKYRIMYSVDETAYELKDGSGTTVSKWDKNKGLTVGDKMYAPQWPHDAGDLDDEMHLTEESPNFYHVIVENHESNVIVTDKLKKATLRKAWGENVLSDAGVNEKDAYATFQLKRIETKQHLEFDTQYYDGTDATVTLIGQDGNTDTLTVKKGAKVKIVATFSASGAVNYTIDGGQSYELSWYSGDSTKTIDNITVTGDITIRKNNQNGQNGQVREDHLELAVGAGSEPAEDVDFSNEMHTYTLNRAGGWQEVIENLPLRAESPVQNGQQTITTYSYYFVEIDSNPDGVYAEMTDGAGNPLGNMAHPINESNKIVVAENKPLPEFYVKKEWHDIEDPDSYPEIRFTLYQGLIGTVTEWPGGVATQVTKVQQGQVFVGENGESYVNIPLNSDNEWAWQCPGYLPTTNAQGQAVGYYVVENTGSNSNGRQALLYQNSELNDDGSIKVAGEEIPTGTEKDEVWLWDYYNDKNSNHAYRNDQQMPKGWDGGIAGNEGTLTIVNRAPKYMQMDIKKKILEYASDGALVTTTSTPGREHDMVLEIQLMRRVIFEGDPSQLPAGTWYEPVRTTNHDSQGGVPQNVPVTYTGYESGAYFLTQWENYGVPFMVGYGPTVGTAIEQDPNDFPIIFRGDWHWTITNEGQEQGLPAYGFYTLPNGQIIKVRYRYIPYEIGAYSNFNRDPISADLDWWIGLQPSAWDGDGNQKWTFMALTAQDQDRLMNIQATDLFVEKDWEQTPDNVEEVFVKIWRQRNTGGEIEDLTTDIATRTNELANYGFVDDPTRLTTLDNGALVLGLTRENGAVMVHNVWLTPYENGNLNSNYYNYWIEEVGYRDSDGNVYFNESGSSATSTFFPKYDRSDTTDGSWLDDWKENPTDNKIKLSTKGKNKLRVKNQPTKDIEVVKEWYDENGNKLTGPWNKADGQTPVATSISFKVKRSGGGTEDTYLTFGGSETLTIQTNGQRAVVRTATQNSTAYTVTYVPDSTDKADIGNWTTLVHGLQKYASNGTEYTYTVEELKDQNGKPLDGNNNVIRNCHTSVSGSEAEGYVIKNEKVVTSLAIKKEFGGDVKLTDEQKKKITFKVTGPNNFNETFTYGESRNGYTWKVEDGVLMLVIKGIQHGQYTVTEQNDGVNEIFAGDTSGKTYIHTRTYTVTPENAGTVGQNNSNVTATVAEGARTDVLVTNTYDEVKTVEIDATKKWTKDDNTINASITNATVTFTLQKKVGEGDWTNVSSVILNGIPEAETAGEGVETFTAGGNEAAHYESAAWKAYWPDLPKLEGTVEIQYRVVETAATVNGNSVLPTVEADKTKAVRFEGGATSASVTITNTVKDFQVKKVWTGYTADPTTTTVTLQLHRAIVDGGVTYEDNTYNPAVITLPTNADDPTNAPWVKTWTNLPVAGTVGEGNDAHTGNWTYYVTETDVKVNGQSVKSQFIVSDGISTTVGDKSTVTNTYDLKPFSFHKKWTDGVSDTARTWPTDTEGKKLQITVTLVGELKDDQEHRIGDNVVTVENIVLNPAELATPKTMTIPIGGVNRTVTITLDETSMPATITFTGLSKSGTAQVVESGETVTKTGEWIYYVTETQVSGYQPPKYTKADGTDAESNAHEGETITNARIVYELPHTGGAGTTMFYVGGASLMFLAVLAYVVQQKKRYHLIGD